jgi:DNA-binding NtrC family response regulator
MSELKATVLVIDDESAMRDYMRYVLEAAGYRVVEASNGREGIAILGSRQVDLMITDLVMPEKEGIETIISIRTQNPKLPIIAMSGVLNSDTYLKVAGRLGAHGTLQKPFKKEHVLNTVATVLAAAAMRSPKEAA